MCEFVCFILYFLYIERLVPGGKKYLCMNYDVDCKVMKRAFYKKIIK